MSKNLVCCIIPLANVDSTILKVNFGEGFELRSIPYDEVVDGTSFVGNLLKSEGFYIPFKHNACFYSDYNFYYLYTSIEKEADVIYNMSPEVSALHESVGINVSNKIGLMRLFKEGSIFGPIAYFFETVSGVPCLRSMLGRTLYYSSDSLNPCYVIETRELPALQRFLDETNLPFTGHLNLAFESFEFSYHTHRHAMAFLSLMTALEILFNPGRTELTYRISRNIAVLLGKDRDDSDAIFEGMKKLYSKRSALTHAGNSRDLSLDNVLQTRNYVRESIKKIILVDESKENILKALNSSGFGSRPFG
ncbi:MAG: HEPN domain-containing protein [Methanothrix sp.]|nr:HEPN domain-containing protein [Methanothrix sp.]